MRTAPPPTDETARLAAVRATGLLDSAPEEEFDEIVRLATLLCRAPFGYLSLVDADRVYFKAHVHFPLREMPRAGSFSSWCLLDDRAEVVPDTFADGRFEGAPALLHDPPVRFWAGAPLVSAQGHRLGALCVLDTVPRMRDEIPLEALGILARQASAHIALRAAQGKQERAHADLSRTLLELADREARLAAVLDTAAEGIVTIDGSGRIQSFNRAAERIFGWTAAEVRGRNVSVLMPEPDHGRHDGYLRHYRETGQAHIIGKGREVTGRRKDGTVFPLYLAVSEVRSGADDQLFTGILRDLTELKEAERLKSEFVSVASHELRTPLASLRGSLGLLEGRAAGPLTKEAEELVRIARANVDRLIRLSADILDLGRIQAGRYALVLSPLQAREMAEDAVTGLKPLSEEAGVRLELQAADARVVGDRDRLTQVLVNLVANAVKFSPRGSPVLVRVGPLRDRDRVRFEVRDRGPGIAAADVPRLFHRFVQLDGSDRRAVGGTGLGLAIAKALVEQHGGQIGVETAPGQGSTFWFEVPSEGPGPRAAGEGAAA
ncbi:MAG TPA: PAS domain S-box protein [Myxococcales bacterium]|jgi:PAS domain S-box-containing protein